MVNVAWCFLVQSLQHSERRIVYAIMSIFLGSYLEGQPTMSFSFQHQPIRVPLCEPNQ